MRFFRRGVGVMHCPQCGATMTQEWRHCPYCDYPLAAPRTDAPTQQSHADESIVVVESVDTTLLPTVTPSHKPGNWLISLRHVPPWRIISGLAIAAIAT